VMTEVIAIACVLSFVVGQMLFKYSAIPLGETGSFFQLKRCRGYL
jgi:hypothetical protein